MRKRTPPPAPYKAGDKVVIHCGQPGKGFYLARIRKVFSPKSWEIEVSTLNRAKPHFHPPQTINPQGRKILCFWGKDRNND